MAGGSVSVKVSGLRELRRALKGVDADASKGLDAELKGLAESVAEDARGRLSAIDPASAAGIKPKLRGFGGVVVAQTKRKRTGLRPDYGALQMRTALIPALWSNKTDVERRLENLLDGLERRYGF